MSCILNQRHWRHNPDHCK